MLAAVRVIPRQSKKDYYHNATKVLTCSIHYPQFRSTSHPLAAHTINLAYQDMVRTRRAHCENRLLPGAIEAYRDTKEHKFPFHPHESLLTYNITYNADCTLSLYFDDYTYLGGAHGTTVRTSDTWDLRTGKRQALSDFFAPGFDYQQYIFDTIDQQIERRARENPYEFYDNSNKLARDTFSEDNFFLTSAGLTVYFQQYDIAPYASGIVEFLIPYGDNVLRPSCKGGS